LTNTALLIDGLNKALGTLDQDWTLMTISGDGRWPHHEKPKMVTKMIHA